MRKLVSLLTITAIAGALAAVPAMAQGTSKQQQPVKQQPTKTVSKTTTSAHKTVSDTVKKGQTAVKHASMAADTSKKGKMAARHTRRHHKKSVSKTSTTKKPAPKPVEK